MLRCRVLPALLQGSRVGLHSTRALHSFGKLSSKQQMPPRPTIKEEDLEEAFLKGSGPGGQKINKTSSAVQLKHMPSGVVVKSQATRSRSQNRKIARRLLAEKLEVMERGSESRIMIKAEAKRKKKASASKKSRRKYRALAEETAASSSAGNDDAQAAPEDDSAPD